MSDDAAAGGTATGDEDDEAPGWDDADDEAAGWDAIDAALVAVYGGAEPQHYAPAVPMAAGGADPLDGISAYRRAEPVPHWHFVGYGLSELYVKESADPAVSGWGFELTFRLAGLDQAEPPAWALNLLQNLARYVLRSGNPLAPGHHMNLHGSITLDRPDTLIHALAFATDPELGEIDTPHGRLRFLQVVGLTADEYQASVEWNTAAVLDLLAGGLPLLVTDLDRASLLADPAVADAVRAGTLRDGSSTALVSVTQLGWSTDGPATTLTVGAASAEPVATALSGRLPYGRPLRLQSKDAAVRVEPGDGAAVTAADELTLTLPPVAVRELAAALQPTAGSYPIGAVPGLTLLVVPSPITDSDGTVVQVVG